MFFFVHACTASSPLKINIVLLQQHDIEPSGGSCLKSANPTSTLTSLNLLTPPRYLVWPRSKLRRWNDHWSLSTHLVVHNSPWKSCLMTTFIARVDTPKIFHQHITWDNCFHSSHVIPIATHQTSNSPIVSPMSPPFWQDQMLNFQLHPQGTCQVLPKSASCGLRHPETRSRCLHAGFCLGPTAFVWVRFCHLYVYVYQMNLHKSHTYTNMQI